MTLLPTVRPEAQKPEQFRPPYNTCSLQARTLKGLPLPWPLGCSRVRLATEEWPVCGGLGGTGEAGMSHTANPMWVLEQGRHGGRASQGPHKDP